MATTLIAAIQSGRYVFSYKNVMVSCKETIAFEDCILKIKVGDFPIYSNFSSIWIRWEEEVVVFYEEDSDKRYLFPFHMEVML